MVSRICVRSIDGNAGLGTARLADSLSSTTIEGTGIRYIISLDLPTPLYDVEEDRWARNQRLQYKVWNKPLQIFSLTWSVTRTNLALRRRNSSKLSSAKVATIDT
jgi:hypothetical protein